MPHFYTLPLTRWLLLLIGFILDSMMKNNLSRTLNLTDSIYFLDQHPMILGLSVVGLVSIFYPAYRRHWGKALPKKVAFGN